jgi:hypothetical protein
VVVLVDVVVVDVELPPPQDATVSASAKTTAEAPAIRRRSRPGTPPIATSTLVVKGDTP